VLGTHGRDGLERLLMGSVAEAVSRRSSIPTSLSDFLRTFVSEVSGDMTLRRVLIPSDYAMMPASFSSEPRRQ
jgi:hypothetical protein